MATFPSLSFVCPIRWSEMHGDEKERFCSKCSRTVVNISLLTEAERVSLLNRVSSNQLCVAYYRRLSGEFVSAENALKPTERRSLVQYGAATVLSAGVMAAAVNFIPTKPNETLIKARNEIAAAYQDVKREVENGTREIVESLTAPFLPKKDPLVTMTLGMVACPPPPSSSGSVAAAPSPESSGHVEPDDRI